MHKVSSYKCNTGDFEVFLSKLTFAAFKLVVVSVTYTQVTILAPKKLFGLKKSKFFQCVLTNDGLTGIHCLLSL